MPAEHLGSVSALRAAAYLELAAVEALLKGRADLHADQISAAAPAPVDSGPNETGDELSSPDSSRESTPDGSGGSATMLGRHSSIHAQTPVCGSWASAPAALSGNVGRLLICLRNFAEAVADLQQPHGAEQKQRELLDWLCEHVLPLLRGFAERSLAFYDDNLPAIRDVVQRLMNAHDALLALDPPAAPCSWGESAGQILTYVYVSEYLCREGVRLNATSAPEGLFAVSITGKELLVTVHASCLHLFTNCIHGPAWQGAYVPAQ